MNYLSSIINKLLDVDFKDSLTFPKKIEQFDEKTIDELNNFYYKEQKETLLQDILSSNFQFMGTVDGKGNFIDINKTILEHLENINDINEKYDFSLPNTDKSSAYLKLRLLEEKIKNANYLYSTNKKLKDDFLKFKVKNKGYVSFLKEKK